MTETETLNIHSLSIWLSEIVHARSAGELRAIGLRIKETAPSERTRDMLAEVFRVRQQQLKVIHPPENTAHQ